MVPMMVLDQLRVRVLAERWEHFVLTTGLRRYMTNR